MELVWVPYKRIHEKARPPEYSTEWAHCYDFFTVESGVLAANTTTKVRTGLELAIPFGWGIILYNRSGLASKKGLVIRSSRVIDSDYRDEVLVPIHNDSDEDYYYECGDRICQGKTEHTIKSIFEERDELGVTDRKGGFGSTGK